jgi:hypothetical protein
MAQKLNNVCFVCAVSSTMGDAACTERVTMTCAGRSLVCSSMLKILAGQFSLLEQRNQRSQYLR